MRVAYVCVDAGISLFGQKGAAIHIQEIIRGLLKRGISVEVFCSRRESNAPPELAGVPIHLVSQADNALVKAIKQQGRFDLLYERYSLWSFAGLEYAREQNIPGLLEVNAPLIEEEARYRVLQNRKEAEEVAKKAFSLASAVIAVSDEVADYVKGFLEPAQRQKVYVVPNGVDPERFAKQRLLRRPAFGGAPRNDTDAEVRSDKMFTPLEIPFLTGFIVGFVGSLKPWHGVANLIEAFRILYKKAPESGLLIVGEGPERKDLAKRVDEAGIREAAHFSGMVSFERVPEYLASMDVGVAPYPALEQFYFSPLKIFEYMAAGLPVVTSDIGQIKKIIHNKQNGLLVPAGNSYELAGALERLRCDASLRKSLGESGRKTVIEKYTWDKVIERILEIASLR